MRILVLVCGWALVGGLMACGESGTRRALRSAAQEAADTVPAAPAPPPLVVLSQAEAADSLRAYGAAHPQTRVRIRTSKGNLEVRLYEDTPLHRANFLRLAKAGFFDQTVFYRVIPQFMVQGGDSDFRKMKVGGYRVPAEIRPQHYHQKGALAMARDDDDRNPERLSSNRDFFLVQGQVYTSDQLRAVERQYGLRLNATQRQLYTTRGGMPHLDGQYTVFGEVISGLDVIDSIAAVPTDAQDWPLEEVRMAMEVLD